MRPHPKCVSLLSPEKLSSSLVFGFAVDLPFQGVFRTIKFCWQVTFNVALSTVTIKTAFLITAKIISQNLKIMSLVDTSYHLPGLLCLGGTTGKPHRAGRLTCFLSGPNCTPVPQTPFYILMWPLNVILLLFKALVEHISLCGAFIFD